MAILEKLTEGIVSRDLSKESTALLSKWEKTGLLEGMGADQARQGMARLLENQASQLLKEASTMAGGDVEGFAAVAFPIVRRVFGGLVANDIVSVQPMSLPSGLIFFLDFTYTRGQGTGYDAGASIYGGNKVASAITGGIHLTGAAAELGPYALHQGYSSPTGSGVLVMTHVASGTFGGTGSTAELGGMTQGQFDKMCRFDPDLISGSSNILIGSLAKSDLTQLNADNLKSVRLTSSIGSGSVLQVRRLTAFSGSSKATFGDKSSPRVLVYFADINGDRTATALATMGFTLGWAWAEADDFAAGNSTGSVVGQATWALENQAEMPEIDIKVDSIAVTAITKKLKAKWSPELGQDLNAYHNLDAEVELTSILSEQIALEIDREILGDLIAGATAGTYYWSRSPGMFLNRETGQEVGATSAAPDFTGTVSEWYETLIETINDVSAQIHRKTLRGGANFVVTSPEVANIMEFTSGFRASITADAAAGTVGAVKAGSISKKWDVYVDPYFPRNVVLVGRKGASFLESGYVYAPYVPLQVTPTIFGPEDFVPRKGVMTRYAKQMVRPDMYGLVVVRGLLGESGS
jgi:hypothetical protein|tara:strand:+ start:3216 stop:4952 length:1737 start_codon:yes stop_codon:yes gene_type:complete